MNPILFSIDPFFAGWVLVLEFIFTLAMALKCYPLQPGGLLAVEAVVLGMTTPEHVFQEAVTNFPVILLLMFMVAGIYFLREMLPVYTFTKILLGVRSKVLLSLIFSFTAAVLSAFLDALTVTAVIITVAVWLLRHLSQGRVGQRHSITITMRRPTVKSTNYTARTWSNSARSCAAS